MCKEKIINIDIDENVDDDDYETFDFLDDDDAEVNVE